MEPVLSGVESVREYLQRRIERCSTRIAREKKAIAARPRRGTRTRAGKAGDRGGHGNAARLSGGT